ncbi:MAG: hypothetical protein CL678_02710 [Bdellovibrionaceae bacterium]|nr:hypothetical protein [Pseudobdellovibrionaceae bacterium]|tara:strand:- start:328 stop:867 length:540 start_codon:yes stop_codon:yes gene_type:complete
MNRIAFCFLFMLVGCATSRIQENPRKGLIEVLAELETGRKNERFIEEDTLESDTKKYWRWPLRKIQITSPFGRRKGKTHDGVDLQAKVGTPVYAVKSGKVIYAGAKIRGYGRMVVIQHLNDFVSVYAHHQRNLVRIGQKVKKGQLVALSGRSGRVSGPHLHFEIRKGSRPINPVLFLKP